MDRAAVAVAVLGPDRPGDVLRDVLDPMMVSRQKARAVQVFRVALAASCLGGSAHAAPPDPNSEDGKLMAPFAEWFRSQRQPGGASCCDESDGRPVEARIDAQGHWEAHVTPQHFPGWRDEWIKVPDDKVLRSFNPTGSAILWAHIPHRLIGNYYFEGHEGVIDFTRPLMIYCFRPSNGA